jgi:hypothetical protein
MPDIGSAAPIAVREVKKWGSGLAKMSKGVAKLGSSELQLETVGNKTVFRWWSKVSCLQSWSAWSMSVPVPGSSGVSELVGVMLACLNKARAGSLQCEDLESLSLQVAKASRLFQS